MENLTHTELRMLITSFRYFYTRPHNVDGDLRLIRNNKKLNVLWKKLLKEEDKMIKYFNKFS